MQNIGSQRPDLHGGNRSSNSPRPGYTGTTLGSIQPPIAPVNSKPPAGAAITGDLTSAELVDEDAASRQPIDEATASRQTIYEVAASRLADKVSDKTFEGATSAISPWGLRRELVRAVVEDELLPSNSNTSLSTSIKTDGEYKSKR